MKNYRIPVETYLVIEAESPEQARRELTAREEFILMKPRQDQTIEDGLLLNILSIGEIVVEPKRDEYDDRLP